MSIFAIGRAARGRGAAAGGHAGQSRPVEPATRLAARLALAAGLVLCVAAALANEPAATGAPAGASTGCCADPAQFPYESLPAAGAINFVIDAHGPSFEFQSGRSFFHAFRLPAATRGYTVEVQSFLEPATDPRHSRVFYPVLALLTDDFLVARVTDLETLSFDLPTLERTSAPAYRISLAVEPSKARERYLVVFTPAALLATRSLPPITGPDNVAQVARVAFLGAAPVGRLRVTVRSREGVAAGEIDAAQAGPGEDLDR